MVTISKKNKAKNEARNYKWAEVAILNRVVRKVTEEMTLEQRIRGSEGVSQMGKKFPSRGHTGAETQTPRDGA